MCRMRFSFSCHHQRSVILALLHNVIRLACMSKTWLLLRALFAHPRDQEIDTSDSPQSSTIDVRTSVVSSSTFFCELKMQMHRLGRKVHSSRPVCASHGVHTASRSRVWLTALVIITSGFGESSQALEQETGSQADIFPVCAVHKDCRQPGTWRFCSTTCATGYCATDPATSRSWCQPCTHCTNDRSVNGRCRFCDKRRHLLPPDQTTGSAFFSFSRMHALVLLCTTIEVAFPTSA